MSIDQLSADLRFAGRTLARRPGVALLTVLTLSLGIGASTAMFSVVESVLLRPLPYPEADRLVTAYPGWPTMRGHPTLGDLADRGTWSWPEFFGVAESQDVFERLAAYEPVGLTLTGEGPAERVSGARATWQLFPLLGAVPSEGRLFSEDDDRSSRLVVLSHGVWRDRFGSDPAAVGRTLSLNGEAFQVIGVLQPGFEVPRAASVDFWVPMTGSGTDDGLGNHGGTRAIARLAPGVSVEDAMAGLTRTFASVLPSDHGVHEGSVFPLQQDVTRTARPAILVMLAASILLLLVSCGNAAAFLLGAGFDRERELAVRGAMGASRQRIATQLLVESSVLAVLAIAGGVVAAAGLSKGMIALAPAAVPGLDRATIDLTAVGFAALAAVVFGVGFGMIPALSLSDVGLADAMNPGRRSSRSRARLQSAVVVGEIGLATVLAVTCLLLVRTVGALDDVHPGFAFDELAAVAVAVPFQRFQTEDGTSSDQAVAAYQAQLREELASLPGVRSVAVTSVPPFSDWRGNNTVVPESWDAGRDPPIAERRFVSPGFFETAGIEILEGRAFTAEDAAPDAPYVVVISEGLARLGWPDSSPIGRPFGYWGRDATVVGVARSIRDEEIEAVTDLAFYAPGSGGPLLVRTDGDPAQLIPSIRARIRAFDEDLPILLASSLEDLVLDATAEERYRARLMTMFAVLAGLLSLLGIYGVASRSVARRTREIGIRVALGARHARVWRMVSQQAVGLAVVGAVLGVVGAATVSGLLEAFLWGVDAHDPATLAAVLLGLPLLAVLAALGPAVRATRIDPREALKAE